MLQWKRLASILCSYLIAGSVVANAGQTVAFQSSSKFNGKTIELVGDLSFPKGSKPHPAVILLHGCGGLEKAVRASLNNHARALNRNGFATLILDSFGPRNLGGGWVCRRYDRLSAARYYRQKDVRDAIGFLSSSERVDARNIFLMGQSNGGSVVTLGAAKGNVRAAAAYYPWCGVLKKRSASPILILSGTADDWTPPDDCVRYHNPANGITVKTYPGATHSFDLNIPEEIYQGHRLKGDRAATSDSRRRMIAFFKSHLRR